MIGYFEQMEGDLAVLHTGVFVTDEELRSTVRVHHAEAAVSMLAGRPATPAQRVSALCRAYGLPCRDDGARWAIHPESGELLYAFVGNALTPTLTATFADGSAVTVNPGPSYAPA
jgi:hypothetical protein